MRLIVEHPPGFESERRYIFKIVLEEFLGLQVGYRTRPGTWTSIHPEETDQGVALRVADVFFAGRGEDWLAWRSLPIGPVRMRSIPAAYAAYFPKSVDSLAVLYGKHEGELIRQDESGIEVTLDIFGSAFFVLTRYEEAVRPVEDDHDRFPSRESLLVQAGLGERPVVDEYVHLLWLVLSRLWPKLERKRRQPRLVLTHDVDNPYALTPFLPHRILGKVAADLLLKRRPDMAWKLIGNACKAGVGASYADRNDTFDWLMDVSERNGCKSAFYFICSERGETEQRYDIRQAWAVRLVQKIVSRGHEIGLHPSYDAFSNPAQLALELGRLTEIVTGCGGEARAVGGRHHYLRWRAGETSRQWEECGLAYDSSVGFVERVGFRAGSSHPFTVYDLTTRRHLNLVERPLVLMEQSLIAYMGCEGQEAVEKVRFLAEQCRAYGGDFVMLWHNDQFIYQGRKELYERMVLEAKSVIGPAG